MFRVKDHWEYVIIISTGSKKVPNELLFQHLPFNAQVGILGHELSHTLFCLNKSLPEMISIGIKYLNSCYRIKLENETDLEVIGRGLGWQLLDFAIYCRSHPKVNKGFLSWLDKYYLNPSRILNCLKKKSCI